MNTTNTADAKPAALISDAFTILSPSWNDSMSSTPLGITATPTTINAAILAGNVPSQDPVNKTGSYSGGVMNLPRLLEAWSGQSYSLNGALVCLFTSTNATQPFQMPGAYYNAPSRRISFDNNFQNQNKLPPGTPGLRMLSRTRWSTPPINTLNYAGY